MSVSINTSVSLERNLGVLFGATNNIKTISQRLSSGIRINSAADDAANLCLSKKLDLKSSGIDVANRNIQTGVSTLQTFDGYLGTISNDLQRIRDLAVQASSGQYSSSERSNIDKEAQQLLGGIQQGSNQANKEIGADAKNVTGTIAEVKPATAEEATAQGFTAIKTAAEFKNLINAGLSGKYMLMNDIDMAELGTVDRAVITGTFTGSFDGNGYKISGLNISSTTDNTGLFGQVNAATIKNVTLQNATVSSGAAIFQVGSLVGSTAGTTNITNCAAINTTVNAAAADNTGGLIGFMDSNGSISTSFTTGNVNGHQRTGGLVGHMESSTVAGSYSLADTTGTYYDAGGLVGVCISGDISSSYATGNVSAASGEVGGLVGYVASGSDISSSYATGNVSGGGNYTGGFLGFMSNSDVTSSYATGNATGTSYVAGFAGTNGWNSNISNSYATGNVSGSNIFAGGFVGSNGGNIIDSCYSAGSVSGNFKVGGFAGQNSATGVIANSATSGAVSGTGGVPGGFIETDDSGGLVDATNYWNQDASGLTTSAGLAVGKTNEEYNVLQQSLAGEIEATVPNDGTFTLQISETSTGNYSLKNLGLDFGGSLMVSLGTASGASSAISGLDEAINYLSSKRAEVGTEISSLNNQVKSNQLRQENTIGASGRIKDADMANESAKLVKEQIRQNMGITLFQQDRSLQSNTVMQLIGGIHL